LNAYWRSFAWESGRAAPPHVIIPLAVFFLFVLAAPGTAQTLAPVRGAVVDPAGDPVAGASVEVLGAQWWAETGPDGRFRIDPGPGEWTLVVRRIGFRPDTVTVPAAREAVPIRVVLERDPVQLRALTVDAPRAPVLARTVTRRTIRQAPALAEPDVFRSVVLLPGVSQPNDLKGRIHLGGGASDETGFVIDGHTLQDPFHLLGLTGAFNVAAMGRANVLLHETDAASGGRVSGIVDLTTRPPEPEPSREAVASLLTTGATVWQPGLPADLDLLVSARVTYLDKVVALARELDVLESDDVPRLGYHDILLRLGRSFADWRVELLGFRTADRFIDAEYERARSYDHLTWGEQLVGLRLRGEVGRWRVSARGSYDAAWTRLDARPYRPRFIDSRRGWASGSVRLWRTGRRWRLDVGADLDHRTNDQEWVARGLLDELFAPSTPPEFQGSGTLTLGALHGAIRAVLGRASLGLGGRVWLRGSRVYPAPRLSGGLRLGEGVGLHAALERRFQFDAQSEEPLEGSVSPPLFLLDTPRRVDAAAFGLTAEAVRVPGGGHGRVRAEAFARRYPDRPVLADVDPGTPPERFPWFRRVEARAVGGSVSGRLRWERWAVQGSYAYQHVREEHAPGEWSPTAWDAPHTLSLYGTGPGPWGWTLTGALQLRSGGTVTPVTGYTLVPDPPGGAAPFLEPRYLEGTRNSLRLPAYQRLDVGARKSWSSDEAEWTVFVQVLNLLLSDNPIGYDWAQYFARHDEVDDPSPGRSGLPIIPSFGLEVRW
jgi:hypothetical protein